MNIFLQTVLPQGDIILFDAHRNIISREYFSILGNESSRLIGIFDTFLEKNNVQYTDIENIVVVTGP